jgi:hypothetical protein
MSSARIKSPLDLRGRKMRCVVWASLHPVKSKMTKNSVRRFIRHAEATNFQGLKTHPRLLNGAVAE